MSEFSIKKYAKEQAKHAESFAFRYGAAALVGGVIVSMAYSRAEEKQDRAIEAVKENFIAKDRCLDDTAYDTSNGAIIDFIEVGDTDTVRIMPKDANAHKTSVLFITEADNGWYGFGDNRTAAFLLKQECDGIPDGF